MGFVVLEIGPTLLNPGVSSAGMRFSGTPGQARMVLAIFGAAGFRADGVRLQALADAYRCRSKRVIYFAVALAALLVLLALVL